MYNKTKVEFMKILLKILKKIAIIFAWPVLLILVLFAARISKKYQKNPKSYTLDERYTTFERASKVYYFVKDISYECESEKKVANRPTLFIANHKSSLDPIVILHWIKNNVGSKYTLIAKKELEKGLVGSMLKLIDTIFLDRDNLRQMFNSIEKQKELLKNGRSILIFPEGERNKDNTFLEFKSGVFEVAYRSFVPIQPIVIKYKNKNTAKIEILEPIKHAKYMNIKRDILSKNIQKNMQKEYNKILF